MYLCALLDRGIVGVLFGFLRGRKTERVIQNEQETFWQGGLGRGRVFFMPELLSKECAWNIILKLSSITFANSETFSRNSP